jgi:DNA-binding MarR family transcriptional regulator
MIHEMNYYTCDTLCQTFLVKKPSGAAFLLSQVGAGVAAEFGRRLAPLGLTPAHVGVLRTLAFQPGMSQQALGRTIGALPSRVVKLLDELDDRGLVERRRSTTDRRNHELHLSPAAADQLAEVRKVVSEHDRDLVAALTADELADLLSLLGKVASAQGLGAQDHPGYRSGG